MIRAQRLRLAFVLISLAFVGVLYIGVQNQYQIQNALSYSTRPLWDTPDGPTVIQPHYYAEGLDFGPSLCQLHGWNKRPDASKYKVFDAILMSSELDVLEIRLNELDAVVDRFFILESNATFTGLPKETYFADNRARFAKFEKKISYSFLPGYSLPPGKEAFDREAETRNAMTQFLRANIEEFPPNTQPLVIMSDVDEIPTWQAIKLLTACDFGNAIHLQLRNYLYSFEWLLNYGSWRASVHRWTRASYYRHSKIANTPALADAGWHCSYCFRTIPEYVVKMKGFSHSDRIGGRINLLDPGWIQGRICKGQDIFGMLPEAYNYLDLFSQLSLRPQTSMVGVPRFLIENAERFKFLLPGGCIRNSTPAMYDDLE